MRMRDCPRVPSSSYVHLECRERVGEIFIHVSHGALVTGGTLESAHLCRSEYPSCHAASEQMQILAANRAGRHLDDCVTTIDGTALRAALSPT